MSNFASGVSSPPTTHGRIFFCNQIPKQKKPISEIENVNKPFLSFKLEFPEAEAPPAPALPVLVLGA